MERPRHDHPTPAELGVLQFIWEHCPRAVRQGVELLEPQGTRHNVLARSLGKPFSLGQSTI